MTLTEKILARAAGKARVQAGDNIWVKAHVLMTHDVCGPGTIGVFKREFGANAVSGTAIGWSSSRTITFSRLTQSPTGTWTSCAISCRSRASRFSTMSLTIRAGIGRSTPPRARSSASTDRTMPGVCHTALPQKGHTRPGEILFGTDSHTCMAGAFNEFATGIGNTDAGFVMGTGKLLLKTPETMHFRLEGRLSPGSWPRTSSCTASVR